MITIEDILADLRTSNLILADEVLSKIENEGWYIERDFCDKPTECKELYKTYTIRNKRLGERTSEHARQLYKSTNEFTSNLSQNIEKSCYLNDISGSEDHDYFFAFEPENKKILGLMKVYSQLKVSKERWQQIWAKP